MADEVRKLSQESSDFNFQVCFHIDMAKNAVYQARNIIEEMAAKDTNIPIVTTAKVDCILDNLTNLDKFLEENLSGISGVSDDIGAKVNLAIQSLQIEDYLTNAIKFRNNRILNKLEKIHSILDALELSRHLISKRELRDLYYDLKVWYESEISVLDKLDLSAEDNSEDIEIF